MEWRLITGGSAELQLTRNGAGNWETDLHLESAGLVTKLYRVLDTYKSFTDSQFCPSQSILDAQEGKRHRLTKLTFDNNQHKVEFSEQDLIKNTTAKKDLTTLPCTHEIVGALAYLRTVNIDPGKSISVPVTDGKKVVNARVEAQAKETVNAAGKPYQAVRYEAFLFDNVLYKRHARMLIWISDDSDRIPVQVRIQLGFPIGSISLVLNKEQKL